MYLWVERKPPKDLRQILAAVAEGPFLVIKIDNGTLVIEKADRSIWKVSNSRFVLAPRQATNAEVEKIPELLMAAEIYLSFQTKGTYNLRGRSGSNAKEGSFERKSQVDAMRHKEAKVVLPADNRDDKVEQADKHETEEYVIEKMTDYKISDERHRYAKKDDRLYLIRW